MSLLRPGSTHSGLKDSHSGDSVTQGVNVVFSHGRLTLWHCGGHRVIPSHQSPETEEKFCKVRGAPATGRTLLPLSVRGNLPCVPKDSLRALQTVMKFAFLTGLLVGSIQFLYTQVTKLSVSQCVCEVALKIVMNSK